VKIFTRYRIFIIVGLLIALLSAIHAQETPDTPYTSISGAFTVIVPSSWIPIADEQGVVTFADSATANFVFSEQNALESGQLVLQIFAPNSIDSTPQTAMDTFIDVFELGDLEAEEIRIGSEMGLRLAGDLPFVAFAFITRDGDTGFAIAFYSQGELEEATDRTVAVLETITTASLSSILSEAPAEQLFLTYENESLGISFDYPTGWGIDDTSEANVIYIANSFTDVDDITINRGRLSSRMYLLRPSTADFRLGNDASLQSIAEFLVEDDLTMFRPDYIEIDDIGREALVAYENVMTLGEGSFLLLRIDEDLVLVWRVRTADGEFPRYFNTLKSILGSIQAESETVGQSNATETQFDVELSLRDEFELDLDLSSGISGIYSLALSPDETVLAITVQYETDAYVIDAGTGQILHKLALPDPGQSVSFSPDGETLMVVGGGYPSDPPYGVKFFDVESGESVTIIDAEFEYGMEDGMFTSDGSQVVLTGSIETPAIFDVETGESLAEISTSMLIADSIGQYYAHTNLMGSDQHLRLLDAETQQILSALRLPEDVSVDDMSFSSDNRWIAIFFSDLEDGDDRAIVVDVENNEIVSETQYNIDYPVPEWSVGSVNRIAFAPDPDVIAVSMSNVVTFYEVGTGTPLTRFSLGDADIFGIAFTADGHTFYTASDDNIIRVWDVEISEN